MVRAVPHRSLSRKVVPFFVPLFLSNVLCRVPFFAIPTQSDGSVSPSSVSTQKPWRFLLPLFYCPYLKYFPCRRQSVRLQPCTLGKELLKLQQNKTQKEQTSIEVHLAAELIVARFFVGGCVWCKIIIDRPCKTKAEKDE